MRNTVSLWSDESLIILFMSHMEMFRFLSHTHWPASRCQTVPSGTNKGFCPKKPSRVQLFTSISKGSRILNSQMYLFNCDFLLPFVQNQIGRKKLYFFQILVSLFIESQTWCTRSRGSPHSLSFVKRGMWWEAGKRERGTGRLPLFSLSFPSHHLLLPCALGEDYWGQVK